MQAIRTKWSVLFRFSGSHLCNAFIRCIHVYSLWPYEQTINRYKTIYWLSYAIVCLSSYLLQVTSKNNIHNATAMCFCVFNCTFFIYAGVTVQRRDFFHTCLPHFTLFPFLSNESIAQKSWLSVHILNRDSSFLFLNACDSIGHHWNQTLNRVSTQKKMFLTQIWLASESLCLPVTLQLPRLLVVYISKYSNSTIRRFFQCWHNVYTTNQLKM